MLNCLSVKALTTSSTSRETTSTCPPSEASGISAGGTPTTPGTSVVPSPTVNLSREYAVAVQTNSYSEIWSKIHVVEQWESDEPNHQQQLVLAQVLRPNRECVEEALRQTRPTTFTQLVSTYFEHSEKTCHLLLLLHHSIYHARSLYAPIHDLVDDLPINTDSMTQFQCDHANDVFLKFDQAGNPFPCPDSHNFNDMRYCFSQLKQQIDHRLHKSRVRVRFVSRATIGSAICLIGAVVGVVVSAVVIATHALVALVATSFTPPFLPFKLTKQEIIHMAQLDAAAKSAFVLHNDLDTIDRLVARLYSEIEGDKSLVHFGLDKDKHTILEVVKQLGKNKTKVLEQLTDLEEHICLCFAAINRARSLLLLEIQNHQSYS